MKPHQSDWNIPFQAAALLRRFLTSNLQATFFAHLWGKECYSPQITRWSPRKVAGWVVVVRHIWRGARRQQDCCLQERRISFQANEISMLLVNVFMRYTKMHKSHFTRSFRRHTSSIPSLCGTVSTRNIAARNVKDHPVNNYSKRKALYKKALWVADGKEETWG